MNTWMHKRKQRGYTMIEVLMSLSVMTVGAMGVMALQKATKRGNLEARQMTVATNVARQWIERLRRDSLNWTAGAGSGATVDLTRSLYIKETPTDGTASGWMTPIPPAGSGESYAFDHFGNDTLNGSGNTLTAMYCVNVNYQWVFPGQAIRADVRVWWYRQSESQNSEIVDRTEYENCAVGSEASITDDQRIRFVQASTVLRWNPVEIQ
jgi:prepilin-type N-terminal cleavage/methylation domain-containing protein